MQADNITYASDQIVVPLDYGEARCICGGKLDKLLRCSECHSQFNGTMFHFGLRNQRYENRTSYYSYR